MVFLNNLGLTLNKSFIDCNVVLLQNTDFYHFIDGIKKHMMQSSDLKLLDRIKIMAL